MFDFLIDAFFDILYQIGWYSDLSSTPKVKRAKRKMPKVKPRIHSKYKHSKTVK